jgi:biotin transport system substrate-specific component
LQIGPVPVVLTNFFIILVGLLLGWRKTLIIVITYILLGAVGLPVFSGGKAGLAHILGLTGGFLLAFIPLGFFSGVVSERGIIIKLIVTITASALVYVIGVPWAMNVYNSVIAPAGKRPLWDVATTLKYTTIPFLIPDLIKAVTAVLLSTLLKPVLRPFIKSEDE